MFMEQLTLTQEWDKTFPKSDFADYLQLETKYFTAHGGAVPEETLHAIREYGKTL